MKIATAPALAGGFLLLFALVLIGAFVSQDRDLVRALAQGLLNVIVGVAAFYFGSSEGSRRKDSLIGSALTGQGAKDAAD